MKKMLLVFFYGLCFFAIISNMYCINFCNATSNILVNQDNFSFVVDLGADDNISKLRKKINGKTKEEQVETINKLLTMNFSLVDAINYVYPNFEKSVNAIAEKYYVGPQEPSVYADENNCKILFKSGKNGVKMNKNAFYLNFYDYLCDKTELKIAKEKIKYIETLDECKSRFNKVAEFETSFNNGNVSRVNNIEVACKAINGAMILSGEEFSFNKATGIRNEANGYSKAKIIKNGEFVDGVGGGVCQVSTTLYNACLLAGLTVSEVHNHTLPVSYVKPCFDAMVNIGSADLRIKNNTSNDYIITTSVNGGVCRVCIYGIKPEYEIKTRYEKYEVIQPESDLIETKVSIDENLDPGEVRISYGAEGYKAKGYIDYYKDGVLIKSELIRDNVYAAKRGVVWKVE